jgi:hypothetical protein
VVRAQKTATSYHAIIIDIVTSRIVSKAELAVEEAIFIPLPDDGAA